MVRRDDGGFTLTELLVTIVLLSVLMTLVLTTTVRLYGATTDSDVRTDSLNRAQTAMDAMSKQIRLAVPITVETNISSRVGEATPGKVTVFAATTGKPAKVTFQLQAGQLVQQTVVPDTRNDDAVVYTQNPVTTRVLAAGVTNGAAMFEYVLEDGSTVATAADNATRARIEGVRVTLRVLTVATRRTAPAELTNTIYPFNPGSAGR
jgi:prepilin-type N-terminal cleavage/methylation domain-containing protein